jgi:hypothetical protein
MRCMKLWIVPALAVFMTACLAQTAASATPVVEVAAAETFVEPTATPECQHFPGVTLETVRISDSTVELHVTGLEPGEIPYVTYETSIKNVGGSRGESGQFVNGADEQGAFTVSLPGLFPLKGQTSATWDIQFIHARGVECTTISLP